MRNNQSSTSGRAALAATVRFKVADLNSWVGSQKVRFPLVITTVASTIAFWADSYYTVTNTAVTRDERATRVAWLAIVYVLAVLFHLLGSVLGEQTDELPWLRRSQLARFLVRVLPLAYFAYVEKAIFWEGHLLDAIPAVLFFSVTALISWNESVSR